MATFFCCIFDVICTASFDIKPLITWPFFSAFLWKFVDLAFLMFDVK